MFGLSYEHFIYCSFVDIIMKWVNKNIPDANKNWNLPELYNSFDMYTAFDWRHLQPLFKDLPTKYNFSSHKKDQKRKLNNIFFFYLQRRQKIQ